MDDEILKNELSLDKFLLRSIKRQIVYWVSIVKEYVCLEIFDSY